MSRTALRRVAWALIVIGAGIGLRGYRIDNDIARWTPGLAGAATAEDFVLVGFAPGTLDAPALADRLRPDPAVRLVLPVAGDGALDGLLVAGTPTDDGAALPAVVRAALGPDADRVALAGPAVFRAALDDWSQRGLPLASGLILVIGAIVMAATTRRLRAVVESLVAVFSSQVALVGLISATGTPMDMVLSMTPPLLMGLGYSFAAHRATRPDVGRALRLSMVTTAAALGSFAFTDFAPIRAFALWGAIGIGLTWLAVTLVVTPPRAGAEAPADAGPDPAPGPRGRACLVVALGAAVTVAGVVMLPRLRLEEDTVSYFPPDARIARDYRRLDRDLTGTLPFRVVVDDAAADATALLAATDGVRRVVRTPGPPGGSAAVYLGLASSDAVPALAAAQPAWQAWAAGHGTTLRWQGVAAQIDFIARSVWRTATWALPSMLVVAALAALLVDRRWTVAALSVWVNGFPVAVIVLLLGAGGRPVGLPTLVISALAVGVAIDDTLHLLIARRRLGSFARALRACRRPCAGSSLAVAACMAAFLCCPFRPTAEFGTMMAITVLAALVGDLVLLPAAARVLLPGDQT